MKDELIEKFFFITCTGGVTSMDVFLKKFFLSVYMKKQAASSNQNNYCKFDSQLLTLFTSSLYITGLIGSMVASYSSRRFGRKATMLSGGAVYLVGAAVNGAAYAVWMLILGRLLLGAGIGLVIQVKHHHIHTYIYLFIFQSCSF